MVSDGAGGTVGATILTFTVSPFIPPPGEGGGSGSTGGQEGQVLDLVRTLGPAVVTPCLNITAFCADKYGGTGHKCVGNGSN